MNTLNTLNTHNTQPVLAAQAALDHIEFSAVIMPDVTMKGDIHSPSTRTVAVMGTVIGDIVSAGPVFVFPNAKVYGSISASEARLMGDVLPYTDTQQITIKVGFCHLGKDGYVRGHLEYSKIVVEDGSRGIDGTMKSFPVESTQVDVSYKTSDALDHLQRVAESV